MINRTNSILMRGHACSWTGYGRLLDHLGRELQARGKDVSILPERDDTKFGQHTDFVRSHKLSVDPGDSWLLEVTPMFSPLKQVEGRRIVKFSMWESTVLTTGMVEQLNQCAAVIVPCQHNAIGFSGSGVTKPIYVAPLGVSHQDFWPSFVSRDSSTVVFGAAGRSRHGRLRKNHEFTIEAFQTAFPDESNVRLEVRSWPDDPIPDSRDPRVVILRDPMSIAELSEWYRSLDVFVHLSRGEGWGMQPHEAMACGTPLIACKWSGLAEFFDDRAGWPVDFDLRTPVESPWTNRGVWAVPRLESAARAYRSALDPTVRRRKAEQAAELASRFTWGHSAEVVLDVLQRVGFGLSGRVAA